jgi:hypothetical protein
LDNVIRLIILSLFVVVAIPLRWGIGFFNGNGISVRLLLSDIVWFKVIAYCIAFSLEEEMINYFSSLDVALNL